MKITFLGTAAATACPLVFCRCPACRRYSRAYIRHLLKVGEMLGMRLCVLHNLYFYNELTAKIREALNRGEFESFFRQHFERLGERV